MNRNYKNGIMMQIPNYFSLVLISSKRCFIVSTFQNVLFLPLLIASGTRTRSGFRRPSSDTNSGTHWFEKQLILSRSYFFICILRGFNRSSGSISEVH